MMFVMKRGAYLLLIALIAVCWGCQSKPAPLPEEDVLAAAQHLKQTLGQRLKSTLQREGPVAAIAVCTVEAMPLTTQASQDRPFDLARITDKPRNPANAANAQERDLLARMRSDLAEENLQAVYRLDGAAYVPLRIEAPCLICHGNDLAEPVVNAIDERYPADQARGYALGDLRGAVVVKRQPK